MGLCAWNPNPFKRLEAKLKATASRLSQWSDLFVGHVKRQTLIATKVILRLDMAMEGRPLSAEDLTL